MIPEDSIEDIGNALDINKDGMIDFNEFLEAFRLVSLQVEGAPFGDGSDSDSSIQ